MKNIKISLSGSVGVGKSTLTKNLSENLANAKIYEEPINEQLLELFYTSQFDSKQVENIELANQISFFTGAIITTFLSKYNAADYHIIDRPFSDHKEAFSYLNLSSTTYDKFQNYVEDTKDLLGIKPTGLTILLRADTETVIERIKKRGRSVENNLENYDYFRKLNDVYNSQRFADKSKLECDKLVIIDTTNNSSEKILKIVLDEIKKYEIELN